MFTSFENLAVDASLCLEIQAPDRIVCVQDLVNQINQASSNLTPHPIAVSHQQFIEKHHVTRYSSDNPFPFLTQYDSLIHQSCSFRVIKGTHRETNEIRCLKIFTRQYGDTGFEKMNDCASKLMQLRSTQFEMFHGMAEENGRFCLLHDYYKFTVETLVKLRVPLSRSDCCLIMRQMLDSIVHLASLGYIYPDLDLSSFLLSEVSAVKLGGLFHAIPVANFRRLDPKYLDSCAPEFILGARNYCEGYSVWNLGCLLFEIASHGLKPFGSCRTNALQQINAANALINEPDLATGPLFWKNLPLTPIIRPTPGTCQIEDIFRPLPDDPIFRDLIRGMLTVDVHSRWSMRQCLEHEFLSNVPEGISDLQRFHLPECPSMHKYRTFYTVRAERG
jgi:serine/threonine protein kinase